jgi:predicted dehydrogenase
VLRGVMIGAGFFAGFQAEGWRRIEGVRIAAVSDPAPGRAAEIAQRWGIPRHYSDTAEMLQAERPHFVDIATRPESHRELTELAARHEAHVICQKPMAPAWTDCVAMVEVCREHGVRLLIHENWRWQPWYRETRRLIDAGAIGTPFYARFHIRTGDGRGPEPYSVQPYFRTMERFLVQETLVHFLDTLRFLMGEVETVFCRTARVNPAIRGEDSALIQLGFESGAAGVVDANRTSGPDPPEVAFGELVVEGDAGAIRVSPDGQMWLNEYGRGESPHVLSVADEGYRGDSVCALQQHLVDCLRSGAPAEAEGEEYLKTAALVFACYRSAETGQVVGRDPPHRPL